MFGVKEVHKVKSGAEVTDRIVGQYNIRLVEERRSEFNPSGLLVAEYSEQQMVGERTTGLNKRASSTSKRRPGRGNLMHPAVATRNLTQVSGYRSRG